jgi:hypothetical protein
VVWLIPVDGSLTEARRSGEDRCCPRVGTLTEAKEGEKKGREEERRGEERQGKNPVPMLTSATA